MPDLILTLPALLLALTARRVRRQRSEATTFLHAPVAAMEAVPPQQAENDNALAALYEEVERALRRAGHL